MITVQWADSGEKHFTGMEFKDNQYHEALDNYNKRTGVWSHVRIILADDEDGSDWTVIYEVRVE